MAEKSVRGYLPNDTPPFGQLVLLGFQHILTMFPATVFVAAFTGFHVGTVLLGSGISTIVALVLSKRGIGKFIPLYYGSSFSYIAPVVAITVTNIYGIEDPVLRIRIAQGGIMMTGLLNVLVGVVVRYIGKATLDKILPPEVTGSVAIVIGIALSAAALGMAGANWGLALVTLVVTVLFSVYLRGKGFLGMIPILLGALVGYLVGWGLGLVDFTPVGQASWVQVPRFTLPVFWASAVLAIAPIAIATIPESTAHLYQALR